MSKENVSISKFKRLSEEYTHGSSLTDELNPSQLTCPEIFHNQLVAWTMTSGYIFMFLMTHS